MKSCVLLFVVMISGLLVPYASGASSHESLPLSIVEKSTRPQEIDPARSEMVLALRNESELAITAWKFACVVAESDGNFTVSSRIQDAFFEFERRREASRHGAPLLPSDPESGLLYPGEGLEVVIPKDSQPGLYGALSCDVAAVILADGSSAGEIQSIEGLFENRAKIAADARRSIEILSRMSEALRRPDGSTDSPFEELAAEIGHGQNWYREVLVEAEQAVEQKAGWPSDRLDVLLGQVRQELALVERHLTKR